jgi:membrane-bound inhibitor of C-type lysozyme
MRHLAAFLLALPAVAQDVPEGSTYRYACDDGATLAVAYINPPDGVSYAVVAHDGRLIPMKAGPTGSGVRYISLDHTGLVWHTKGLGGFLAHDDADETMIAANCSQSGG